MLGLGQSIGFGSAVPRSRWVLATAAGAAAAWSIGMLPSILGGIDFDEATPAPALFGVYLVAGLFMAATVAVLTGFAARRIASDAAQLAPYVWP